MVQSHIFDQLSSHDQQVLQRIFDGTDLPPLYSDTIAKRVFDALGLEANAADALWSANPKGELQVRAQAQKPPQHPKYELLAWRFLRSPQPSPLRLVLALVCFTPSATPSNQ